MKEILSGEELVGRWRNGSEESPAGPLFASGPFAEAEITADCCGGNTCCGTDCTGSWTRACC
jgi:hypothetical protein